MSPYEIFRCGCSFFLIFFFIHWTFKTLTLIETLLPQTLLWSPPVGTVCATQDSLISLRTRQQLHFQLHKCKTLTLHLIYLPRCFASESNFCKHTNKKQTDAGKLKRKEKRPCAKCTDTIEVQGSRGMCHPSSKCRGVISQGEWLLERRRLPCGQQGGSGPQGKALNFCQAQITTPFFTSWFLTEKIILVPSHMNSMHTPWVNSGSDGMEFTLTRQSLSLSCCGTFSLLSVPCFGIMG